VVFFVDFLNPHQGNRSDSWRKATRHQLKLLSIR